MYTSYGPSTYVDNGEEVVLERTTIAGSKEAAVHLNRTLTRSYVFTYRKGM